MSQRNHETGQCQLGRCYPLTAAFSQGLWDRAKGTLLIPAPTWKKMLRPRMGCALPGQSCWRKVYVATSRAAELERPPPRGMSLAMTAVKPGTGPPAGRGEGRRGAMNPCRAVCAPQLMGNDTRSPCATFQSTG